jgi:hypothetical protein
MSSRRLMGYPKAKDHGTKYSSVQAVRRSKSGPLFWVLVV